MTEEDLVTRLRRRAEIRRSIQTRKSVQEGQPDRIADLLEEAADEIESLEQANLLLRTDPAQIQVCNNFNPKLKGDSK